MDLYCVLGNPVEHSKSPWIHARFAQLTGQQLEYGKRLIPLDAFVEGVRQLRAEGYRGCNVTVPFKYEAGEVTHERSPRAALAGACNVLRFDGDHVYGDNTDGLGLVDDLQGNAGMSLRGRAVLLVGAGGAAAGVLGPLIEAGPAHIAVANRTAGKAATLVHRHQAFAADRGVALSAYPLDAVDGRFDVVINATATSMTGAAVPVAASVLAEGALAYDMMYGPAAQGFLGWARAHGAQARDGLGMLVEQAAEAFALWRGVRPPSAQVLAELRATLA
jgi:shikimate dehydrogenase